MLSFDFKSWVRGKEALGSEIQIKRTNKHKGENMDTVV